LTPRLVTEILSARPDDPAKIGRRQMEDQTFRGALMKEKEG
jgi:hypothetical protein